MDAPISLHFARSLDGAPSDEDLSLELNDAFAADNLATARAVMREVIKSESSFTLDYAEIIDEDDFSEATESTLRPRAIISGWLNGVRLIDNMAMRSRVHE